MTSISEAVRQQVRRRAANLCEYCREPEDISLFGFHLDHILALQHGGSDDIENLAWACPTCNIVKGPNIASYDLETGKLLPLYNPRKDRWADHFETTDDQITGKTPVGRVTVKLLEFNNPEKVEARRNLIQAGQWKP